MKKILLAILLSLVICPLSLSMSGCGSSTDENTTKVGTLTQLNSTPEQAANISGGELNFYENFNSMQMALSAKHIDKMQTYQSVAKYLTAINSDFAIDDDQRTTALVDNFCCAVREDNVDLKNDFDEAIESMKADGTLDALTEKFIRNPSLTPPAVALPTFDNANVILVGITGDLPPLDLVLADGTPAGFNTAVLAEIGNRLLRNIELVDVDSGARAAALTSNQVDAVFWAIVPVSEIIPKDSDKPKGIALTEPYFKDKIVHMIFKANEK